MDRVVSGLRIAFRVDASVTIGTGHLVRCLTLAQTLRAAGADCVFLSRSLSHDHIERIRERGCSVHLLAEGGTRAALAADDPPHTHWLPVPWQDDARETRELLKRLQPDWLIVDHYALDARWEAQAAPPGTKVMAIDDLADRPHRCDKIFRAHRCGRFRVSNRGEVFARFDGRKVLGILRSELRHFLNLLNRGPDRFVA